MLPVSVPRSKRRLLGVERVEPSVATRSGRLSPSSGGVTATRPTRQGIQFAVDALSLLPVGGNATARVRLLQAIEKLTIAVSYLPETESPRQTFKWLSR